MSKINVPFYFAVPRGASAESRARVPQHIAATFDVRGRIEFVREDKQMRLYRVVST